MRTKFERMRRLALILVIVGLVLGPQTTWTLAAGTAGNVVIRGKVGSAETGEPIAGARVYAVHLDTKQVFTSALTNAKGEYQITGLPFGYYDIAVETTDGLYLANRVINAPAGEKVDMSLMLGPPQPEDTEWWSAEPDRRIPGLDRVPSGVARIVEGRVPLAKAKALAEATGAAGGAGAASAGAAAAGGAAVAAGTASWLVPALAVAGMVGLAAVVNDDNDTNDSEASEFE